LQPTAPTESLGALPPRLIEAASPRALHGSTSDMERGGVLQLGATEAQQECHGGNTDELRVLLNERHERWLLESYLPEVA
jgi:hypothetical protein